MTIRRGNSRAARITANQKDDRSKDREDEECDPSGGENASEVHGQGAYGWP
jgi:hypothetical protein